MPDNGSIRAFVARVGQFYVTDKKLKSAQARIESLLAAGEVDQHELERYLAAVRTYFGGFEKEARAHLRGIDKRLEHVNQVHFNLTAERGVAVRRIEATQSVLSDLENMR